MNRYLEKFDLIQVVAGHPAWALVTTDVERPTALQVATLASVERDMKRWKGGGLLGIWRSLMTEVTTWLGDRALRSMDVVFVENEWMKQHVQTAAPSARTVFAPPGVDTDRFTPSETPFGKRDYILSVGRFGDRRKNPALLFEAYAQLSKQLGSQAPPLVLAGRTSPPDSAWAVAERRGVREEITFHENVSEERLVDLYREAKLFLLSSDEEGLGLVLLEAMACGVPVVSTNCGGPATVVRDGHTGKLVPTGNADALADAAARLLHDDEVLEVCGRNARRRAIEHFSEDAAGQRFLEAYEMLIGEKTPNPTKGAQL